MEEKLNYIQTMSKKMDSFKLSDKERIYETTELLDIINQKWKQSRIRKAKYIGDKLRYIPVTNLFVCPRKLTYSRYDHDVDIDIVTRYPYTELITSVGQFIHDYIAKLLDIYEITKQYLINDEYKVRGKCDGILYNALIEIKTVEVLPDVVDSEHLLQARILFDMAKLNGFNQIDLIKILYIKRNLKEFKEFNIHVDEKENKILVKKYYELGKHMYECLQNNKLSPKVETKDCFFCEYQKICEFSINRKKKVKEIKPDNVSLEVKDEKVKPNKNVNLQKENQKITDGQNKSNDIEWIT